METETKPVYTCPMHPEVREEKPGICEWCGMRLLPERKKKSRGGKEVHSHNRGNVNNANHHGHGRNVFARRFWVSLILTIPVLLLSELASRVGITLPDFPAKERLPLLLSAVIYGYGGWVFLEGAYHELRARLPGMMTLVALAVTSAFFYSVYAEVAGKEALYWELSTLVTIMLLGHWIEMRAVTGASGALRELSKLLPDKVLVFSGEETEWKPLGDLREGDRILVKPGGKIAADGVVESGDSEVNESMITGESKPVRKQAGSEAIAGSVNGGSGALEIRIEKIGEHTFLAGVMRLVADAEASKSRLQILSDRAAGYLTLLAIVSALATLASWSLVGTDFGFTMERVIAVLVITCPHALGLAIPLVASISTKRAAENGFLVRERRALESARNVTAVVFDKTGTLTTGEFKILRIIPSGGFSENDVLQFAASIDAYSEHFIAQAVVKEARVRNLRRLAVSNFLAHKGKGVEGVVEGEKVFVGGISFLDSIALPEAFKKEAEAEEKKGNSVIYIRKGSSAAGAVALGDAVRPESKEAVAALKRYGVEVVMMTGDGEDVARHVAGELGIKSYFARVAPEGKSEAILELKKKGKKVAMVGDGINDAPALATADIGIAIGAGTNVAIESAGIILIKNDPRDVAKILKLAKLTYRKMIQNLFWATAYNIAALPIAAGALAAFGIFLQPAMAAVFMSLSTIIVALNALTLRRAKIEN